MRQAVAQHEKVHIKDMSKEKKRKKRSVEEKEKEKEKERAAVRLFPPVFLSFSPLQ